MDDDDFDFELGPPSDDDLFAGEMMPPAEGPPDLFDEEDFGPASHVVLPVMTCSPKSLASCSNQSELDTSPEKQSCCEDADTPAIVCTEDPYSDVDELCEYFEWPGPGDQDGAQLQSKTEHAQSSTEASSAAKGRSSSGKESKHQGPSRRLRLRCKTPPHLVKMGPRSARGGGILDKDAVMSLIRSQTSTKSMRDFYVVRKRLALRDKFPQASSSELLDLCRREFYAMDEAERLVWCRREVKASYPSAAARMESGCEQTRLTAEQTETRMIADLEKSGDDKRKKCMGALGTWNGRWLDRDPDWLEFLSTIASAEEFARAAIEHRSFQGLVLHFEEFLQARCEKLGMQHWSYQFEHSTHAEDKYRIHIHAFWHSNESRLYVGTAAAWAFQGANPVLKATSGRGRSVWTAFQRGHLYCQIEKIGYMVGSSNYTKYQHFAVQQRWIIAWWQQRKLSHEAARKEIIAARGHTASYLKEIDNVAQLERDQELLALQATAQAEVEKNFVGFKTVLSVELWKYQYRKPADGGAMLVEPRFKFLVLNGPSCFGKTQFSKSLFGSKSTLVLSCQGVSSPCLRDFRRDVHQAILFDEIASNTIVTNKLVFQASIDGVVLGQSQCNEHAYRVWLYGVPLIISVNDWMEGIPEGSEEGKWLQKNSVLIQVTEPLWKSSSSNPIFPEESA